MFSFSVSTIEFLIGSNTLFISTIKISHQSSMKFPIHSLSPLSSFSLHFLFCSGTKKKKREEVKKRREEEQKRREEKGQREEEKKRREEEEKRERRREEEEKKKRRRREEQRREEKRSREFLLSFTLNK